MEDSNEIYTEFSKSDHLIKQAVGELERYRQDANNKEQKIIQLLLEAIDRQNRVILMMNGGGNNDRCNSENSKLDKTKSCDGLRCGTSDIKGDQRNPDRSS